ncbi:MAG: hypothetical protein KatS3mg115_2425 [Candidatus Poribacteria bacterium]|nr:MAG: hypothetical protein KatS3mg115_2425 [Candidatus Poribacteria bacterium]
MIQRLAALLSGALALGTVWNAAAQGIVIDGDLTDWERVPVAIEDPKDMGDLNINGDYKEIKVASTETDFYALQCVWGNDALPADQFRYYYHILIDADNNVNTGITNDAYEGNPTGVQEVIGADFYIQIGWRAGAPDGIEVYHLPSGEMIFADFPYADSGGCVELSVPFAALEAPEAFDIGELWKPGSVIKVAAFQEGNAEGWGPIDWTEPAEHVIGQALSVSPAGKLAVRWADLKAIR